jgi:DNA-binding IclR family transcriptional regulator
LVQPAPAVVRSVDTMNFLAANPRQPFTLSELSKRLDINMASLLAILQALTDAGYVTRHPRHKTYTLGPSLVAVGQAALAQHHVVEAARPAMRTLAAEFVTECIGSVLAGDEMVIVATEGVAPAGAGDIRVGQRIPMVPPLGTAFLAWAPEPAIAHWLGQLAPSATAADRKRFLRLLAAVRERGYALGLDSGPGVRLGRVLHALAEAPADRELGDQLPQLVRDLRSDYGVVDLDPAATYTVRTIVAPVFDGDGQVALALTVNGFDRPLLGAEVADRAGRVVAIARSVTKQVHGRPPQ